MSKYISKAKFHEILDISFKTSLGALFALTITKLDGSLDLKWPSVFSGPVFWLIAAVAMGVFLEVLEGFIKEIWTNLKCDKFKMIAISLQLILILAMPVAFALDAKPVTFLWLALAQIPAFIAPFVRTAMVSKAS